MMAAPQIDWAGLMVLGLHHLRLSPDVFWALTPVELSILVSGQAVPDEAMSRGRLDALLRLYPDKI